MCVTPIVNFSEYVIYKASRKGITILFPKTLSPAMMAGYNYLCLDKIFPAICQGSEKEYMM